MRLMSAAFAGFFGQKKRFIKRTSGYMVAVKKKSHWKFMNSVREGSDCEKSIGTSHGLDVMVDADDFKCRQLFRRVSFKPYEVNKTEFSAMVLRM